MINTGLLILCCMGGFGLLALAIIWRILTIDPPEGAEGNDETNA